MTPEEAKPPKPYRIGEAVVRRPSGSAEQGASDGRNAALTALGASVRRREECGGHRWPPSIAEDDAADELLKSLSVSATPTEDLHHLVTHSRYTPTHDLSASTHRAVEQLRLTLTEIVISHCDGNRALSSQDMRAVVAALDSAHGLTPSLLTRLIEADPSAVSDAYLFHPELVGREPEESIKRARELLGISRRLLTPYGNRAVVALASQLSYAELSSAICRMTSPHAVEAVLEIAGSNAERLAFDLLRNSPGVVLEPAARLLGDRARPLLRRQLRRRTFRWGRGQSPVARELVGAASLRLASERTLRLARDPVEAAKAYALLPGDEPREPLRRLLDRADRLDRTASTAVSVQTAQTVWMMVVSGGLAQLVEPDRAAAALRARRMDDGIAVQLLRALPEGTAPDVARALWEDRGWGMASVLWATGEWRPALAREAWAAYELAADDRAAAALVTQTLAAQAADDPAAVAVAQVAVTNRALPATLRAVAGWVSGVPAAACGAADDPVLARYVRWREHRAPRLTDPLAELYNGQWLSQVLSPES